MSILKKIKEEGGYAATVLRNWNSEHLDKLMKKAEVCGYDAYRKDNDAIIVADQPLWGWLEFLNGQVSHCHVVIEDAKQVGEGIL